MWKQLLIIGTYITLFFKADGQCIEVMYSRPELGVEQVPENSRVGAVLVRFQPSSTAFNVQLDRMSPVGNTPSGLVTLESLNRGLVLKQPLDPNNDDSYPDTLRYTIQSSCTTVGYSGAQVRVQQAADVIVNVVDVNESPPVFSASKYFLSISELSPVGTTIMNLKEKVNDPDKTGGNVRFYITDSNSGHFAIPAPTAGMVTVVQELDYSKGPGTYSILVKAVDDPAYGQQPLSSSATVVIRLEDKDNMNPAFTQNAYTASVTDKETGVLTTSPAPIHAYDQDLQINTAVRYQIKSVHPTEYSSNFLIDDITGTIGIARPLTGASQVTLTLGAYQLDNPVTRQALAVLVITVNQTETTTAASTSTASTTSTVPPTTQPSTTVTTILPPLPQSIASQLQCIEVISQGVSRTSQTVHSVDLPENMATGSVLAQIRPSAGVINVTLNQLQAVIPPDAEYVTLNTTQWRLILKNPLDKNNDDTFPSSLQYRLFSTCSVSGFTGSVDSITDVTFNINDVNEAPPKFTKDSYNISMEEGTVPGTFVFNFGDKVMDPDQSRTPLSFKLLSNGEGYFGLLDNTSGIIMTTKELNSYGGSTSFTCVLEVADNLGQAGALSSISTLTITVTKTKGKHPVFARKLYTATVENDGPSVVSIQPESISAANPDGSVGTQLKYSIDTVVPADLQEAFKIDVTSGQLTLNSSLGDILYSQATLVLKVSEGDTNGTKADTTIVIVTFNIPTPTTAATQGSSSSTASSEFTSQSTIAVAVTDATIVLDERGPSSTDSNEGTTKHNTTTGYNGQQRITARAEPLSTMIIIGVVAGNLLFFLITIVVIIVVLQRWRRNTKSPSSEEHRMSFSVLNAEHMPDDAASHYEDLDKVNYLLRRMNAEEYFQHPNSMYNMSAEDSTIASTTVSSHIQPSEHSQHTYPRQASMDSFKAAAATPPDYFPPPPDDLDNFEKWGFPDNTNTWHPGYDHPPISSFDTKTWSAAKKPNTETGPISAGYYEIPRETLDYGDVPPPQTSSNGKPLQESFTAL
ncbi:protocadherin Fat 3-like [Lingula anatina]|uniref:Protocadherin Fat 3-like n=1 Tax=Lingula anatina TaxID=7574 RepID=A0A2R2MK54_LINAN|nr:protocadherin Fat 3-like [Lingula anatina]|eukprot:XP_023930588.1 protocadherin Fat 3-like [Lingula anatina]